MPIKYAVCDWNGTLFRDRDEGNTWKHVGMSALRDSTLGHSGIGKYVPTLRTLQLLRALVELKGLAAAYKRGEVGYDEIYRAFNGRVLSGIPQEVVETYVSEYAAKPETQAKVDDRLLRPIREVCREGAKCDIISTGYNYGIRQILGKHTDWFFQFGGTANYLEQAGTGSRFNLDIYTPDDKRNVFELYVGNSCTSPRDILFMGDNQTDEPCMGHLRNLGGHVAVPFFADEAFKQRITQEFGAFAPESESDFLNFLRKA